MEKRDVISSCDRCCFHAFGEVSLFPSCWTMPRTKFHSRRRPKRRAPVRGQKTTPVPSTANGPSATASGVRDSPRTASTTGTTASSSATASERKLSKSPHTIHESSEIESESENEREYEGKGVRMLEVAYNRLWEECAVASVNLAPLCFEKRCQGVCTFPYLL